MSFGSLRHVIEHVDTDAQGVVHFTRYLSLFETVALRGLDRHAADSANWIGAHRDLAIATVSAVYRCPARYAELLEITAEVERVTGARIVVHARATTDDGRVEVATGALTFCLVDHEGRAQRIPPELRSSLVSGRPTTSQENNHV
ncbi:thioesterase family protein [Nocardia sp. CNY236]|uniref:acyl-CoA thioesterase n=1 Tax=Nocardia sp. CNY236 TaxID=1169152 RepID=UPI00041A3541|nr:thioesterase family protein [Nocardia sp. CNY236]